MREFSVFIHLGDLIVSTLNLCSKWMFNLAQCKVVEVLTYTLSLLWSVLATEKCPSREVVFL